MAWLFLSLIFYYAPCLHFILGSLASLYPLYNKHFQSLWLLYNWNPLSQISLWLVSSFVSGASSKVILPGLQWALCIKQQYSYPASELLAIFYFIALNVTNIICLLIDCFSLLDCKLHEGKDVCIFGSLWYQSHL